MSTTTTSSPDSLGNTPLLHLLASMVDRQATGTLTFETPDHTGGAVVFQAGVPSKVSAEAPRCKLSELLIELGWLDPNAAKQTYGMAIERQDPHGRVLLDCQLVDPGVLSQVLLYQLIRKLDWIATRPDETLLDLHEDVDLLEGVPSVAERISPLAILWGIAKSHVDERSKRAVLLGASNRPLRLHEQSTPELFGFNDDEMALVDRLRHASMDTKALLYQVELPRQTAEALLYLLLLTRHIDPDDGRMPIGLDYALGTPVSRISGDPPPKKGRLSMRAPAPSLPVQAAGTENTYQINHSLAAHTLRRATQLLKRDRLLLAEAEAHRARELDPENPNCLALHSWIRALLSSGRGDLEQILASLGEALQVDPMNVQTRFYRSEILKRLGRIDEAAVEWQLITNLDPTHIDAQRELRLWEMRRTDSGTSRKPVSGIRPQLSLDKRPTSLFGKLFRSSR